jgi:PPK2 family polyphosphate:nucleotide phosphotransferase
MSYCVRVEPGTKVDLGEIDTRTDGGLDKREGRRRAKELYVELAELQQELYAASVNSVLIVLQGMDTSGKDGTIRNVLSGVNPQGCQVTSFKTPTAEELAHDFLWRVHARVPAKGMIGVFNRSHYEDVVIVRVHQLVPEDLWQARYQQINDFERLLADSGTVVCKFFLHISLQEQERRLLAREADVDKAYKLSADDWRERRRWDDYLTAYQDALTRCSTPEAPWMVVPADRKWFRNLAVADALVDALRSHRQAWHKRLAELSRQRLAELAELRAQDPEAVPGGQG